MLLVVDENLKNFKKIDGESFHQLNIWERKHLQEWLRQAPEMLGEELLVLSIEFDRFTNSKDRLDILALDRDGNIVVVELKRDPFAGYADLQSIRYAAMVSSLTIESLLPYYLTYQQRYLNIENPSKENSLADIQEFVTNEDFEELSNTPRIILCSEDFSQEITTTVLWLNANGLDISCVKITPHNLGDRIAIVPTKIIPLQEAKQYLVEVRKKEEKETKGKRYRPRTMNIIVNNNLLEVGEKIYLRGNLPNHVIFEDGNPMFRAEVTGKLGQSNAIKWDYDGKEYAISALTWKLFKEFHQEKKDPGGVNGNWHWVNKEGKNLWAIAEEFWLKHSEL